MPRLLFNPTQMNPQNHISLGIAQQFKEWGCELGSKNFYFPVREDFHGERRWELGSQFSGGEPYCRAYDILNDICVRYAKEFFGEGFTKMGDSKNQYYAERVFNLIFCGKKQEAEQYILEHTVFNPKNK